MDTNTSPSSGSSSDQQWQQHLARYQDVVTQYTTYEVRYTVQVQKKKRKQRPTEGQSGITKKRDRPETQTPMRKQTTDKEVRSRKHGRLPACWKGLLETRSKEETSKHHQHVSHASSLRPEAKSLRDTQTTPRSVRKTSTQQLHHTKKARHNTS